jgi:hypothetical protein
MSGFSYYPPQKMLAPITPYFQNHFSPILDKTDSAILNFVWRKRMWHLSHVTVMLPWIQMNPFEFNLIHFILRFAPDLVHFFSDIFLHWNTFLSILIWTEFDGLKWTMLDQYGSPLKSVFVHLDPNRFGGLNWTMWNPYMDPAESIWVWTDLVNQNVPSWIHMDPD